MPSFTVPIEYPHGIPTRRYEEYPDYIYLSQGRNGLYITTGVNVFFYSVGGESVALRGITSKGQWATGWLELSPECMDEMCEKWLRKRGRLE